MWKCGDALPAEALQPSLKLRLLKGEGGWKFENLKIVYRNV